MKLGLYAIFDAPEPSFTVAALGAVGLANRNTLPQPFGQISDLTFLSSPCAAAVAGMSASES